MSQAKVSSQLVDPDLARKRSREILQDIVTRFGDYPDVSDYVGQARAFLAVGDESKEAAPTPPPAPQP